MSKSKPKYKPNIIYKNAGWVKRNHLENPHN